ncbi:hypothetical protein GC175_12305 [bacterium]|nr:hypothetical protein [bacterium]
MMSSSNNHKQLQPSVDLPSLEPTALELFVNDICGGDEDIIADLLETYCESTRDLIREMEWALETDKKEELRRAAHSMKSSCRIFGAEWLARNCEQIESLALEGATESIPDLLQDVRRQTNHLRLLLHEQFTFQDCMAAEDES